ncbi:MAG: sugar transferase [Chlorogloea purpurea SAG 13.99]|nr:sugar transferase [Chlorogloea purpurea SAG 13.99]
MKHLPQWLSDIRAPQGFRGVGYSGRQWFRLAILLCSDISALVCGWLAACYLNQFYSPIPAQLVWWQWFGLPSLFWVFVAITIVVFAYNGLYSLSKQSQNYLKSAEIISFVHLGFLVLGYFYDPKLDPPRSLFFTSWFATVILVVIFRLFASLIIGQIRSSKRKIKVFLIASGSKVSKLAQVLEQRHHYQVVGAALSATANSAPTFQAILDSGATEVLAEDIPNTNLASGLYWHLRRSGIPLRLLPSSREILYRRGIPEVVAGLPTIRLQPPLFIGWDYQIKRLIDFCGAFFGLILLAPLFAIVAIIIKISSPGPIFFRQERIGLQGKVFQMWKFRTMVVNAPQLQAALESQNDNKDGVLFKLKHDPRIINCGHFLRKTSIDELPQLFNVLLGEMSLVGPRPLPLRDVDKFDPWHHMRHTVLPGITGLWQVSGRSDIADFDDAARLDLYYIDNWSLNMDLDILVETARIVLFGKGAY